MSPLESSINLFFHINFAFCEGSVPTLPSYLGLRYTKYILL
ncbi:hypothetical protein PVAP13_8NG213613 [Panicum virgatum]|uniref:Uncharacterized protein n=1 Tax=Panicum virgatum TaxID=38727 RepID=A0A8T0PBW3_PANVG|nr:hypothetical protein PVAP13_8NG213613 [Panicum virgatum]